MTKKFNKSLFVACIIGGIIGFLLAEEFYRLSKDSWYLEPLVGSYFAIVAFCISLFGVISEYHTNHISARAWDSGVTYRTIGLLALLVLVGFLVTGSILQFIYGLGKVEQITQNVDDYIIMIDNSGSTATSDPDNERFSSVVDFVKGMKEQQRIMISVFDDTNQIILPITQIQEGLDLSLQDILSGYSSGNGTNIEAALSDSYNNYSSNGRRALAILLSDGECSVNINAMSQLYSGVGIPLFTVGYNGQSSQGKRLMEKLAYNTGGYFYEISGINSFEQTYGKIVHYIAKRSLLENRTISEQGKLLYIFERVLIILIIVFLLGPGISLVLDSSELLKGNLLLRIFSGFAAGLILEIGLQNDLNVLPLRFIACILMSLVLHHYQPVTYENIYIPTYEGKSRTPQYFDSSKDSGSKKLNSNEFSTQNTSYQPNSSKEFRHGNQKSNRSDRKIPKYK